MVSRDVPTAFPASIMRCYCFRSFRLSVMSFFGFDTSLPADDKAAVLSSKDEERALNDKIERALAASAQEDVEVYTWGQDGYDGLGEQLDEANDDVNEDTFGTFAEEVGTDFDFGHAAAAPPRSDRNASAFAASLDDFWDTPALSRTTASVQPPMSHAPPPATLEQVEAELKSKKASAAPSADAPPPRPLTLGEVEAQLLQKRTSVNAHPPVRPSQPPTIPPPGIVPPMVRPVPGAAGPHPGSVPMVPPMLMPPGIRPGASDVASTPLPPPPGIRPTVPVSAPRAPQQSAAEAQAAHLARMRMMLEACPSNVQSAILSLPPPIQFDSLEDIVRQYPSLLRGDTSDAEQASQVLTSQASERLENWKKAEDKRRAKAAKLAHMTRYNGVMSGADKDFITRIQISQLVTSDPYTDDFYAHVFFAVRGGARKVVVPDGSVEAIQQHKNAETSGKGAPRKLTRHENAMLRMQQQVERLVDNRKKREAKGAVSSQSGTLGRVSLVTANKPRQMLQLINQPGEAPGSHAAPAAHNQEDAVRMALQDAALGDAARAPQSATRKALTRRESLAALERLYHLVLQLEQLRREPSTPENTAAQKQLTEALWKELRVLEPLGVSDPHPFVSLLNHVKGKKLIPRVFRLLSAEQALAMLTMLIASFESLDAVKEFAQWEKYRVLEPMRHVRPPISAHQATDLGRSIDAFSNSVLFQMMALINTLSLRIISGMLALLMERNHVLACARTRPGISLLSALLSRAEALRQAANAPPAADELEQWYSVLGVLFNRLSSDGQLPSLFYSTRAASYMPFGVDMFSLGTVAGHAPDSNAEDEPVWNFMALLAIHANLSQQQVLVQELREKILSNILAAKEAKASSLPMPPGAEDARIRNVNLLLHALNLDAAQITL